jgi:hypothetical protein
MSNVDLIERLRALGVSHAAEHFDDIIALATKRRMSHVELLEHIADIEETDRARRGLERRTQRSRLGRFKLMSDFDPRRPGAGSDAPSALDGPGALVDGPVRPQTKLNRGRDTRGSQPLEAGRADAASETTRIAIRSCYGRAVGGR